jgi:hypothetical protein
MRRGRAWCPTFPLWVDAVSGLCRGAKPHLRWLTPHASLPVPSPPCSPQAPRSPGIHRASGFTQLYHRVRGGSLARSASDLRSDRARVDCIL